MSGLSDEDRLALDTIGATPGFLKLGVLLGKVVDGALTPGVTSKLYSCLHILDEIGPYRIRPNAAGVSRDDLRPLVCPQHPEKILCNAERCIRQHFIEKHLDEAMMIKCFVCGAQMVDPITGEMHDFTGITGKVTLRAPVKFYDDNRARDQWFTYSGVLGVLPVAYLCARHGRCVDLPLQMEWPSERSLTA